MVSGWISDCGDKKNKEQLLVFEKNARANLYWVFDSE